MNYGDFTEINLKDYYSEMSKWAITTCKKPEKNPTLNETQTQTIATTDT